MGPEGAKEHLDILIDLKNEGRRIVGVDVFGDPMVHLCHLKCFE